MDPGVGGSVMNGQHIAIRYATALYETALEKDTMDSVTEDLVFLNEVINETPEIRNYCLQTHQSHSQERLFIETAFLPYVSTLTGNMIETAVHNGRLAALPLIPQAFSDIQEKRSGIIKVLLETAHEPAEGLLDIITEKMKQRTGRDIRVEHQINPDLLGGFKLWYADHLIDNSAAGRLTRLQRLLKEI